MASLTNDMLVLGCFNVRFTRLLAFARFLGLYEYPAWDYNVYAEPDMEVANCEPETTPFQHGNPDIITPEEYASWFAN
ncbi:hypothetical protein GUITHDRAFT_111835 [Guillardia theta CCMP2712]|uniref:Uncharacterized protein n=1 Tax=Guillardia theta (strain CCMP2712) TaxID=905079 RepID=L1J2E0_GUITC|nr:hypothetical protein GUITHDRAFT_111835 [Guillardia theta CCMP2712]EKX42274.1 hypothetical protein GUITHDRAFT_111835 [Guillardia theta CCMP2712]|eukprot:XP_005829254.1 hypothetical protein GUITHDRAFT_111835 [Guillardia theta CCMP2712]